jgi:hypothetical protein
MRKIPIKMNRDIRTQQSKEVSIEQQTTFDKIVTDIPTAQPRTISVTDRSFDNVEKPVQGGLIYAI